MYLGRHHDVTISPSGIWRILKRLDMGRLPPSQRYRRHQDRWKRYEKPEPGHRVQVDVKFIARLPGTRKKHYQFTAIDDCTRIRVLRVYDRATQQTAIHFLDEVLTRLPFRADVIQTDNGAEFQSAFHYHVLDRGIGHVYIRPATPRLNGKVERSHRIDAEESCRLLDGAVIDESGLFSERLKEWEDHYDFRRPHGGLGGQTPYERLRQKTGTAVRPVYVSCTPRALSRATASSSAAPSSAVTSGPGSLSKVAAPVSSDTTETVRRVSLSIGTRAAGTPAETSSAMTAAPVVPPANPVSNTSCPNACRMRATLMPWPPATPRTERTR